MNDYSHLVSNPVILDKVNGMTKVTRKPHKEGLEFTARNAGPATPCRRHYIVLPDKCAIRLSRRETRQALKFFFLAAFT
jgi:hypothetical protein